MKFVVQTFLAMLVVAHTAQAIEIVNASKIKQFASKEYMDPDAVAERERQEHLKHADQTGDYKEFQKYANPEEVAKEFGITFPDATLSGAAYDQNKPYKVRVDVDLVNQKIKVITPNKTLAGPVLSGRVGMETEKHVIRDGDGPCNEATGSFASVYSQKYKVFMRNAVFFKKLKIALHEGSLETPSHGCVHLSPELAKEVREEVDKVGISNAVVCLAGPSKPLRAGAPRPRPVPVPAAPAPASI